MTQVFISTGGAQQTTATELANLLLTMQSWPIELSGGTHEDNVESSIRMLATRTPIMLHNYYPPPRVPFVLNIASDQPDIVSKSKVLVKNALDIASTIGSKHYAIHAGFCTDPPVQSLGKVIQGDWQGKRSEALERMQGVICELSDYAGSRGIRLLIENHALTQASLHACRENPLLLTHTEEIVDFFLDLQDHAGLLLDVGHLKVSSNTLQFDLVQATRKLSALAEGLHLHDNAGVSDDHSSFDAEAWFFPHLSDQVAFATVEVHSNDLGDILNAANACQSFFSGHKT